MKTSATHQKSALLAGVDEAGRGPLAGPVVAAAVILDKRKSIMGLADSKTLSEKKRQRLAEQIKQQSLAWAVACVDHEQIDELNILNASMLAMKLAIESLQVEPDHVRVDGNRCPQIMYSVEAVVKGDATIREIGAASILAKVKRDEIMVEMDSVYPGYGFARHKGYPTKQHIEALNKLGVSRIHRRSFAPVRNCIR